MIETSRIDIRVLAAVSLFSSKEETRYYLQGVCVEIEPRSITYIATDGHRLMAYRDDLFDENTENACLGTFIIPTAQCRVFKCRKDGVPAASLSQDEKTLTLEYEDIGVTFLPIDGSFPDWREIVVAEVPSSQTAQFNLTLAFDFTKFAKLLSVPPPHFAHNGDGPCLVTFGGQRNIVAMVMPMRVEGIDGPSPAWALPAKLAEAA